MKLNIIIHVFLITVITGSRNDDDDPFNRIINGQDAQAGEFPWQATLRKYGIHMCGATVIAKQWALTAAHCTIGLNTKKMQIIAGKMGKYKPEVEPNEQIVDVETYFVHENYSRETLENDISLIKLSNPLNFSTPYVKPAALPSDMYEEATGYCNVTGWGYITPSGGFPEILQKVYIPVISDADCQKQYLEDKIYDHMLCGLSPDGKDACQGDSGGPMICADSSGNSYLAGIISWGNGCADPMYPGVYTQVSYFLDWIAKMMKSTEPL